MSRSLTEAAAEMLNTNVKSKRDQADKPERLPGEVQDLGAPTVKPDAPATGPAVADKATKKDTSKSSQTGKHSAPVGQEKPHQMKNKQKVPMQEDQELDEEDLVDEDTDLEEDKDIEENPTIGEEADSEDDDDDDDDEDEKKDMKEHRLPSIDDIELDLSEDIEAMFGGDDFSPEFKKRVSTVYEAAIRAQVKMYEDHLTEAYQTALEETVQGLQEALEEEVSDYLEYVAEEWVKENEVAIESSLRNELAEEFINGLHNLFIEHYIDVPEEKVDVVEALTQKLDEVTSELNEQIEKNVEISKALHEAAKEDAILEASEGLSDAQVEKLRSLAEGVEFKDDESFKESLETLKESYFKPSKKAAPKQLDEDVINDPGMGQVEQKELRGDMARYASFLNKFKK